MTNTPSLVSLIRESKASKADQVLVSVRVPSELNSFIDGLVDQLSLSKQQVLLTMLNDAAAIAEKELALDEESEDIEGSEQSGAQQELAAYHLLNTNKRHHIEDHDMMVNEGVAAAFMNTRKLNIDRIKKGDTVFLYENGKGIVGYGIGTGDTQVKDYRGHKNESHSQQLEGYVRLEKPLPAKQIKGLLDRNIPFLKTMVSLADGQKILDALKK